MLTMFILLARYNQFNVTAFAQNSQLQFNLKSAFEIARSQNFTEERNNKWFKNSFNDDSIKVQRIPWGAYLIISAETKNRHNTISRSGMFGTTMSSDTGLVTSDKGRPIGLSGTIIFKANCYLPSSGIKPAFIEGQSYSGNGSLNQFIKKSPNENVIPDNNFVKRIHDQQTNILGNNDSLITSYNSVVNRPFYKKTVVIEPTGNKISNLKCQNNIKIISNGELLFDSTCHFENVLIIARKVKFKEGFKGAVHVIAQDSIITEKNTEFLFPSSFVLAPNSEKGSSLMCIQIGELCVFNGGIIAISDQLSESKKVFIKLSSTCEVNGFIYSSDYLHVEGKLNCNIYCNTLLLKTPSAVYENHILACEINPASYANLLLIPDVLKSNENLIMCKSFN